VIYPSVKITNLNESNKYMTIYMVSTALEILECPGI